MPALGVPAPRPRHDHRPPVHRFGPTVDSYISRSFTDQPFFADFGDGDVPVQFVHEDDVVDALVTLLDGRRRVRGARGPEARPRALPALPRARSDDVEAPTRRDAGGEPQLRPLPPWVASNEKLKATADWAPRYSSREAFEIAMRSRGVTPAGEDEATPEAVSAR